MGLLLQKISENGNWIIKTVVRNDVSQLETVSELRISRQMSREGLSVVARLMYPQNLLDPHIEQPLSENAASLTAVPNNANYSKHLWNINHSIKLMNFSDVDVALA